ncbi:MAG: isoprenylcysteine carboxylmethyltransferase family protein [Methanobacterium sp.]|uniref:methyltransferase family protein n=1 Tax=Methanobacterium sp. TaxID=2164 RepID=UPI003C733026
MIPSLKSFESTIFLLAILLWILSEYVGAAIIPKLHRHGIKIKKKDRGSRLLLSLGMYVSVIVALYLSYNNIGLLPTWIFYPGIFLIILGIFIRQWSIRELGVFFSVYVGTQKGQKVVKKGPYKLVRHPSYTGLLLTLIGIGLGLQSLAAVIIIILVFSLTFGYRIHVEEKLLISELNGEYIQYMTKTKRLIPYIL